MRGSIVKRAKESHALLGGHASSLDAAPTDQVHGASKVAYRTRLSCGRPGAVSESPVPPPAYGDDVERLPAEPDLRYWPTSGFPLGA